MTEKFENAYKELRGKITPQQQQKLKDLETKSVDRFEQLEKNKINEFENNTLNTNSKFTCAFLYLNNLLTKKIEIGKSTGILKKDGFYESAYKATQEFLNQEISTQGNKK